MILAGQRRGLHNLRQADLTSAIRSRGKTTSLHTSSLKASTIDPISARGGLGALLQLSQPAPAPYDTHTALDGQTHDMVYFAPLPQP